MIAKILINLIAFVLFAYIFLFKMIKKNDTNYITVLIIQALGILISLLQTSISIFNMIIFKILVYFNCIIFPVSIFFIENRGINYPELLSVFMAKLYLIKNNNKKAKEILIKLVTKYKDSYYGHKMLAEIYSKEGGMRKAIDEYVKVLDIKGNDYQSYFKISKLLDELGKKNEAIQMLQTLVNKKPELYEATKLLGHLLIENEKYKEAINAYNKFLKYQEKKEIYFALGNAYIMTNDFTSAKKSLEKVTEFDNRAYEAYYLLGQISLLYRDFDMAESFFLQSIYESFEAKGYYQLAKISIIKNNISKAILYLNKAIQNDERLYKIVMEEPIFITLKNKIEKPNEMVEGKVEENKVEKHLNEVYELTKTMKKTKRK